MWRLQRSIKVITSLRCLTHTHRKRPEAPVSSEILLNMTVTKLLIFTLTFCELIVNLDAVTCPKGQRVSRNKGCQDCHNGSYQPEENDSQLCKACTKCNEESGSIVKVECTKETDTKCQCREGFVHLENDSSTCQCEAGFGRTDKECLKCPDGYFSSSINSPCQKWKDCQSAGVNTPGSKTSDVVCNVIPKSNTTATAPPNKRVLLTPRLTTLHLREGAQTQKMHTTTTTSAPGHTFTPKNKVQPIYPLNTGNHIGMALLIFAIVGLLVMTAVTCKLHIAPFTGRQPAVQKNESLYRRPVEESGDGSLSSLKPNPEEP